MSTEMTVPQDLIERVRKATGPDRAIDYALFTAFAPMELASYWHPTDGNLFTASIDAALALAERVLPGWVCEHIGQDAVGRLGKMKGVGWTAEFSDGMNTFQGQAPTLPLAIVLAVLTALQSSEQSK